MNGLNRRNEPFFDIKNEKVLQDVKI